MCLSSCGSKPNKVNVIFMVVWAVYLVHIIPLAKVSFCVCVLFVTELTWVTPAELVFLYNYSFHSFPSPLCSLKGHQKQVRFCVHSYLPAQLFTCTCILYAVSTAIVSKQLGANCGGVLMIFSHDDPFFSFLIVHCFSLSDVALLSIYSSCQYIDVCNVMYVHCALKWNRIVCFEFIDEGYPESEEKKCILPNI